MENKHIVSFSGGKDSTAMLLFMVENNYQIDEIIFLDTGMEFLQVYDNINKVEKYIGIPITRLKAEKDWEYYMFHHEKQRGKKKEACGGAKVIHGQILLIDGALHYLKQILL